MTDKALLRQQAYALRRTQPEPAACAEAIYRRLIDQPWHRAADTVMWYVSCRAEVPTLNSIERDLHDGKRVVVPYCTRTPSGVNTLALWRLSALSELTPGLWGILEPPVERRGAKDRAVSPDAVDVVIVPGVVFDRLGGRLGNGAGYYDHFLASVGPDCVRVGVCFHRQLIDEVPMQPHDIAMDVVITEQALYLGRGRQRRHAP